MLLRSNVSVPLTAKAFSLLLALVERHGETLDKQTLFDSVWAGSLVEENTLTRTVSMLRKALGENPGQHEYIVTEPGRGYRFVAPLSEVSEECPSLTAPLAPNRRTRKTWRAVAMLAFGLAIVASANMLLRTSLPRPDSAYVPSRLTNHGRVIKAALSPDGSIVVYASGIEGLESLMLFNVASHKTTELLPEDTVHYLGLTFAPRRPMLYAVAKRHHAPAVLWSIDLETGKRQKVLEDLDSPVSFSPDGNKFGFIQPSHTAPESALMIGDLTGRVQKVAGSRLPDWLDYPAWSPDGETIACTLVGGTGGRVRIVAFDADTGRMREIGNRTWGYIVQLSWVDRQSIIFSAVEPSSGVYRLWRLSMVSGDATAITNDLTSLEGVSSTRNGSAIVSIQQQLLSAVWAARSAVDRHQLTVDSPSHRNAMRLTPTTVLVQEEDTDTYGGSNLWTMNMDGTGRQQLTKTGTNFNPSVCADGSIVLVSDRDGKPGIWRMRPGVRNWTKVVTETGTTAPQCSPDSRWIVYSIIGRGKWPVAFRASLEGNPPTLLNRSRCDYPSISPSGRFLACFWTASDAAVTVAPQNVAIIPSGGGDPVSVFPLAQSVHYHPGTAWSPDGTAVLYVAHQGGIARIWEQPLKGGPPRPLDILQATEIFHFHPYPDGQWIVSAGRKSSDIVIFKRQD